MAKQRRQQQKHHVRRRCGMLPVKAATKMRAKTVQEGGKG